MKVDQNLESIAGNCSFRSQCGQHGSRPDERLVVALETFWEMRSDGFCVSKLVSDPLEELSTWADSLFDLTFEQTRILDSVHCHTLSSVAAGPNMRSLSDLGATRGVA
jgi:hypothetical protein